MRPPAPKPAHALDPDRARALTADLETRAKRAMDARALDVAIPLLRGLVAARGPASPAAAELARAWTLAGDYPAAVDVYDDAIAHTADRARRAELEAARARIAGARSPLSRGFKLAPPRQVAREQFRLGRRASSDGDHEVALLHYRIGQAIDPDLPGFLRELALTYQKLGDEAAMTGHYLAYLRQRPVGKLAAAARAALGENPELGTLAIRSSLPCDEVWVSGQRLARRLPVASLALPAGRYRGLCVSYRYEIAYFERVQIPRGGAAALEFSWAIVENRLESPPGRVAVEDPRRPGVMMDLGITSRRVGVVVPRGGGELRLRLRSDDGSRVETRAARFSPGSRVVVRW